MQPLDRRQDVGEFYSRGAEGYDARWNTPGGSRTLRRQVEIVRQMTDGRSVSRLLEIGPGTGRFVDVLAPVCEEYMAMDLALPMLRATRRRLLEVRRSSLLLLCGDASAVPVMSGGVDAVVAINVMNHVPRLDEAIAEVTRALRGGGFFLFNFANLLSYFLVPALYVNTRRAAITGGVYSRWLTKRAISRCIKENSFTVVSEAGNVYAPRPLDRGPIGWPFLFLDALSRTAPFRAIAPSIFLLCRKNPDDFSDGPEGSRA